MKLYYSNICLLYWNKFLFYHVFAFNSSPKTDEGALVRAAKQLNFVFTGRTPDSVIIDSVSYLFLNLFFIKIIHMHSFRDKMYTTKKLIIK